MVSRAELYQSLGSRGPGTVCSWSPSSGHLPFGGQGEVFLHLQHNSGSEHQILVSRCFRKELKQRIWGKRLSQEGFCSVTLMNLEIGLI